MTPRKILGYGHSHLSCVYHAYTQGKRAGDYEDVEAHFARLNAESFRPNFDTLPADGGPHLSERERASFLARKRTPARYAEDDKGRAKVLTEALERRMRHIHNRAEPDALWLICMGNEFNALAMLQHPDPFDFDLPGSGFDPIDGYELIPLPLMREQLRMLAEQNVLLFWRYVIDWAEVPIYVQPPPPPIASDAHITSYPGSFGERAKVYGITPVSIRAKMWRLYCDVLREAVAEHAGSHFVELPEIVFAGGTFAKQFWQEDPTHGNRDYGRIMLDHVIGQAFPETVEA